MTIDQPRSPLADAAVDIGRRLEPDDTTWLAHVLAGYVDGHPDASPRQYSLDIAALLAGIQTACDVYLRNSVAAARRDGASWAQIGAALKISKQTAYSRYGSAVEERNGHHVINDIVRDVELHPRDSPTAPGRHTPRRQIGFPDS